MILTPRAIEQLADRIQRSFLLQCPEWRQVGLDSRLWSAAAAILTDAHREESWVPLDPELFVASQFVGNASHDPWRTLTRVGSKRRYLSRLRKIVRGLRLELREELRRVDRAVRRGDALEVVLLGPTRRVSALGRYLAAYRHGRADLADRFHEPACDQHAACPLYREAARTLAPENAYPVLALLPELARPAGPPSFSLN